MSGRRMIQMIAIGKLNVRHQVNFLFLIPAPELTQDWSEPQEKSSLEIYKLSKGWWSYRLAKRRSLLYPPAVYIHPHSNITMTGKWMIQMTAAEMKPKVMRQVGWQMSCVDKYWQMSNPISKSMFRTGVRRLSRTVTKIRHMSLEQKIGGANTSQRMPQLLMSLPTSNQQCRVKG